MRLVHRFSFVGALVAALWIGGCGSASETVVITERPQPAYEQPADTQFVPPPVVPQGLDTVTLGDFPAGRLWTYDDLPFDYFSDRYGFRPDAAWVERARLATLRLPNCSASFVSDQGLIVTNYHCVRSVLTEIDTVAQTVLEQGFMTDSVGPGLRAPGVHADQLLSISDVTERVRPRIEHLTDDDRREEVLRQTIEAIEKELTASAKQQDTTRHVQVVSLYSGNTFAAYTWRRIHDIRLVMVPEQSVGKFGGDTQNFTYPRYTLDVAFLRAYDPEGNPLRSPEYFYWGDRGVEEGDVVFASGNPGTTERLVTQSQLERYRDVTLPTQLAILGARASVLQQFITQHPALADSFDVESTLLSIRNVQKDARGRLDALQSVDFMRRVQALHVRTDEALTGRDTLQQSYRGAVRALDAVQRSRRAAANQSAPFVFFGSEVIDSHILIRAVYAYLYDFARQRGVPSSYLDSYRSSGIEVEPLPSELEIPLLAARLREFQEQLGPNDPTVRGILRGRTPEAAASSIVQGSALVDSLGFDSLVTSGYLASGDPTVALAEGIVPLYLAHSQQQSSLDAREGRLLGGIAAARLAVSDRLAPDATFSLRLSDGVVQGYTWGGTRVPPYTTFFGMYGAHHGFDYETDFALPDMWLDPPAEFDLSTPLNFVATFDLTGGSSGSPVFTRDQTLVGVAFDSNMQGLENVYLYQDDDARGIAVDVRGVTEALRAMYQADALLKELEGAATDQATR